MLKTKTITINDKEVEIKKMAVGQFAKLMLAVEKLPSILLANFSLEDAEKLDINMLLLKLPPVLASSQDELFKVIEVASGIKKKEIEALDFEEFFDVVIAVLELNKFQAIVAKIKNLKQVLQQMK